MSMKQIVVIGIDQKHYLGKVNEEDFGNLHRMTYVTLHDVYQLAIVDQMVTNPQDGRIAGMHRVYMLMNVGSAQNALKELHLKPAGWYDPEACGTEANMERLLKQVTESQEVTKPTEILPAGPGALEALGKLPSLKNLIRQ